MIDLEKLEADVRRWAGYCEICAVYAGGIVTGLLVTWVF